MFHIQINSGKRSSQDPTGLPPNKHTRKAKKGEINYLLPSGEDEDTINRHRVRLQQMYKESEPDKIGVRELMKLTFSDRRNLVVSMVQDGYGERKPRPIAEIVELYPFLRDSEEVSHFTSYFI